MNINSLEKAFFSKADPVKALKQSKYMRGQFPYFGLYKEDMKQLSQGFLEQSKAAAVDEIIHTVYTLFEKKQREFSYTAIAILTLNMERFNYIQFQKLYGLLDINPWWDTIDSLQKPFNLWVKNNLEYHSKVIDAFIQGKHFWYWRSAIILQLLWKHKTNTDLLEKAILAHINEKEFFIQKAIGWSLRDYSKTEPLWVKKFLQSRIFSALVLREASKYL